MKIDNINTHIQDHSLSWFGTVTPIQSGGAKQVLSGINLITDRKNRKHHIYIMHLHFIAVWTTFDQSYFKVYCSKKRTFSHQRKPFISAL